MIQKKRSALTWRSLNDDKLLRESCLESGILRIIQFNQFQFRPFVLQHINRFTLIGYACIQRWCLNAAQKSPNIEFISIALTISLGLFVARRVLGNWQRRQFDKFTSQITQIVQMAGLDVWWWIDVCVNVDDVFAQREILLVEALQHK